MNVSVTESCKAVGLTLGVILLQAPLAPLSGPMTFFLGLL